MTAIIVPADDFWDPTPTPHEHRVYGDVNAQTWCVVDEEDYQWAVRWRWCWNVKKSRGQTHKTKIYMRRAVEAGECNGPNRKVETLYLHLEILKRSGVLPPTPLHKIGDHWDGDTFNCRRENLRWATHSMNSKNLFGSAIIAVRAPLLEQSWPVT